MIKHLVISGGGPILVNVLGAIQHLEKEQFLDIKNIESIYGTSIGAVIGIILSLKHTWETIDDYIVKCPWNTVLPLNTTFDDVLNIYTNKGIVPEDFFDIIMKPLLLSKDLSLKFRVIRILDNHDYSSVGRKLIRDTGCSDEYSKRVIKELANYLALKVFEKDFNNNILKWC
jgi:predicted acylesterase/phospholipase RssA